MDVKPLHAISDNRDEKVLALEVDDVRHSDDWGTRDAPYRELEEPNVKWLYWIGDENVQEEKIDIAIKDTEDQTVKTLRDTASHGFNQFEWNLLLEKGKQDTSNTYLNPGKYTITYKINESTDSTTFEITTPNNSDSTPQRVFSGPEEIEYEEY